MLPAFGLRRRSLRLRRPEADAKAAGSATGYEMDNARQLTPVRQAASADYRPPKVSAVKKSGLLQMSLLQKASLSRVDVTAAADAEVPDAGSAEVKAIRDFREAPGYSRAETAPAPLLQNGSKRPAGSATAGLRRAVKGAAILMSKTFQRIASEL